MKIAIAQLNPKVGDLSGNSSQILAAARQASEQGARLLLTPELSLCGYPPRDLLLQSGFVEVMAIALTDIAEHLPPQLAVLMGTVTHNPDAQTHGAKPLYNSVVWVEAGKVQAIYHKRLLPTYDVFDEDRYFAPGQTANVMTLDNVTLGITVCEDLWNDEEFWGKRQYPINPIAEVLDHGVDFVVNLSASPFCVGKQVLRESLLTHAAQRFGCPIIYVNQVGGNDDLIFDGRSGAVNGNGELILRGRAFGADLMMLDWVAGKFISMVKPSVPLSENEEIWLALILGVKDYAQKCGFTKAVIGLSGGIDSSLVAAIAVEALGAENVLGVLMPSPYSSDHSITDAKDLAHNLQIKTEMLPIETLMQGFTQTLGAVFAETVPGVAEENIQARIRGTLLMALANKFNYLLISTGNKSELSVGYCTLYGDMSGGLAAIADVPKTRVYELCHWINQSREIIPTSVLTKPPSAELRPDQIDQDSLPPYDVLDDILVRLIDQRQSNQDIIDAGHEAELVQRVTQLVKRAEFKRRQAAPGIKITDRAFGTGWRMPIASAL